MSQSGRRPDPSPQGRVPSSEAARRVGSQAPKKGEYKVVVEVDGVQHGIGRATGDQTRDAALTTLGYRVLRFWNREIDHEKTMVLDTIFAALCESRDRK
jgi:hypothetical protein